MANHTDSDRGVDVTERAQASTDAHLFRCVSENHQRYMTMRVLVFQEDEGTQKTVEKVCSPSEMADILDGLGIDRHTIHARGWYDPILKEWVVTGTSEELQKIIREMPHPKLEG